MLTPRNLHTLCVLLLLHGSGRAFKFDMFSRNPQEGDVRLSGSKSVTEGRVEVFHEGQWGTVCDDDWDVTEAHVVCRQLNFPGAKSVVFGKDYGKAPGPIWLDGINCTGTEKYLVTCKFKSWGETDCSHKEDVGVICEAGGTSVAISDSIHSVDHRVSLSKNLGQIFDSGIGCDFLIYVQSPPGNGAKEGTPEMAETICAHKIILSQFPLFNASVGISNITVNIRKQCQPYFTPFIRYIYTHEMDVTFSSVLCLHQMAFNFGVKQLMEDVGRLFSKILPDDASFHSQVSFYKYAVDTKDVILQENCVQYLAWNYQRLTSSPAWPGLSAELLGALLKRSDLVVPDEKFVLQTAERWITENHNSTSVETQAELLSHIRFPMIPIEELFELEVSSPLYTTHRNLYRDNKLKAFQFNYLLFNDSLSNPKFHHDDYRPRIYTAEPWGNVFDTSNILASYHYNRGVATLSFNTPLHSSWIFKNKKIYWEARVLQNNYECSDVGERCESFPTARLRTHYRDFQQPSVLLRNRFVLICQGRYIFQVQDFKENLATVNGTQVFAYPCPEGQHTYQFVVRLEYM